MAILLVAHFLKSRIMSTLSNCSWWFIHQHVQRVQFHSKGAAINFHGTQFNAGSQFYPMKCKNLVNSTQFEHHYQWKLCILILTFAWWSKFCIDDIVGTPKSSSWSNRKVLISTRWSKTGTSHVIVIGCRHFIWHNIIIIKW